ncbi:Arginyl-tRNA synthetase, class Ic isoform 1 [Hibiscus syriacus]|uniref:Arginyl-tRNA synthetase, class Ic isoform 1 n=1 Tax=Hibiscus syriacus TaxID=106335 RepID=A0A6A2YUY3_HIBSY|nr:uncharacterized protein LOC120156645 [Hibiscus syriacus]KAE8682822.1 Arginyl-tRNA synthetase, class Ic isoform 1 [Hibiscus syriacus]
MKMDINEAWGSNLMIMEGDDSSSSLGENSSENSISSTSSSDLVEDASSSSSNGPLYELSDLMAQLPIRRGLSKHYQGKSQSFTSLPRVMSIDDLPKKVLSNRAKMKSCKSYGWGLDGQRNKSYSPKATISKKGCSSRSCFMSSLSKRISSENEGLR